MTTHGLSLTSRVEKSRSKLLTTCCLMTDWCTWSFLRIVVNTHLWECWFRLLNMFPNNRLQSFLNAISRSVSVKLLEKEYSAGFSFSKKQYFFPRRKYFLEIFFPQSSFGQNKCLRSYLPLESPKFPTGKNGMRKKNRRLPQRSCRGCGV